MGLWRRNMTLTPSPLARVPRQLGRSPVPRLLRSRQHAWLSLFVAFCRLCDKTTDFSEKRKRIAALAEVEGRGATGLCSSCPEPLAGAILSTPLRQKNLLFSAPKNTICSLAFDGGCCTICTRETERPTQHIVYKLAYTLWITCGRKPQMSRLNQQNPDG